MRLSARAARAALLASLAAIAARAQPLPSDSSATESPASDPGIGPTAPDTASSDLRRPVPKDILRIEYPPGETREGSVVLELVIDAQGSVTRAEVIEGPEPFASAAVRASNGWRFEPARRGQRAVSARIRVSVRFAPPSSEPEPALPEALALPTQDASTRARPKAPGAPLDVLVLGERSPPARHSLGRAEVRELPGTFGDPYRAVEVMPGVTPILTGVPFFFVRGAPPGNVGYFLDGIRVPLLFHVGLGPSVVHPGIVERVDLYPGGYPARYGRFAGGIVAAETRAPASEFHGEANVRLFDAGALVEAPFSEGRGVALVGGRYSYTAALLSLLAPEVTLSYWDYQARVGYELNPKHRLSLFAFGAYDHFQGEADDTGLGTQFHRLDLRSDVRPDPRTHVRSALTFGVDRTGSEEGDADGSGEDSQQRVQDILLGARVELEHQVSPNTLLRAGADATLDHYRVLFDGDSSDAERARALVYSREDFVAGMRADLVLEPEPGLTVTPGLRLDWYLSDGFSVPAIEPRISAVFAVTRRLSLEHTLGLSHQAPSFLIPIPGLQLSDLRDGLQKSLQASAGAVFRPGRAFQLGLTVFDNIFLDLTDFLGTIEVRDQLDPGDDRLDTRALGHAFGLEVFAKRPLTERLSGYFAYTLSRSTRSMRSRRAISSFDRTHVVHGALGYDLGKRWRGGARVSAYSGMPATRRDVPERSPLIDPISDNPAEGRRAPAFFRLDLRLEKRWALGSRGGYWAFVIELLNATLSREYADYACSTRGCSGEAIGPVTIPSLGLEAFF